jgi:hypothetical protein
VTDELGYRAELANQVLVRLSRIADSDWQRILESSAGSSEYIAIAHELALFALEVLEEEFGPDARRLVDARLQDAAALFPLTDSAIDDRPMSRQILAEGVLLAVLLRGTRGFNHGAYRELSVPFSGVLDLDDVERQARSSVHPALTDYSSVARPAPSGLTPDGEEQPPESKSA